MAQLLPITLSGDNLGQRHRCLNSQVNQAAAESIPFQSVENLPEQAPVDRLFKIDLANKLKDVDYILENIKEDDMLYVCRAFKCTWLLERRDIINPKYLEDALYPHMVMPAISKMKHWLYINLSDPAVCQEFYQYYKSTKFEYAVKFLPKCDIKFLLNEFPKILTKITPHYLKVLGQKYPKLVQIYYDSMASDNDLVKQYLQKEQLFYNSIKCVLKLDPEMFLDITEKYHSLTSCNILSPSATKYILRFHKHRFMAKPELYVAFLLHIPSVAQCLSVEECQELVIKLARADYLSWWFTYANVEPLVKRISRDKRAAFKKRVFVEKDVGEHVANWPYVLPASPVADNTSSDATHVFRDPEFSSIIMARPVMKRLIKKKRGPYNEVCLIVSDCCQVKSELQKLFDEFRFAGFQRTLHELKNRIRTMSSSDRRRDMLLVLVSKTGGRVDAVRDMLALALTLRNEPVHVRAAVIRSLVKRASAWRLPQDVWDSMLDYGRGLGLDGSTAEAECLEGLHAVVMRHLIASTTCDPPVRTAFLEAFSTFSEYKLMESERVKVGSGLVSILAAASADADAREAAEYLDKMLDVVDKYHIRLESSPAVSAIVALAERDLEATRPLLERLYATGTGRRELFIQYLKIRHDDAALLNALRHEPSAVKPEWLIELLKNSGTRANKFLLKLSVYFTEKGGRAEQVRNALLETITEKPDVKLAQPLAMVAGSDMSSIWHEQDLVGGEHSEFAAALRANMHHARPAPDALALGWRKVGMKSIAWRAMRCRPAHITHLVQSLLDEKVKRTVRLALSLAKRTDCVADIFSTAMPIRPKAVLRAALFYFRHLGDAADLRIWNLIKSFMLTVESKSYGLNKILQKVEWVPQAIKPDYSAVLYLNVEKERYSKSDDVLKDAMQALQHVSEDVLECVMAQILANMDTHNPKSYPAIVIRYLMLSKNDNELKSRFSKIGEPFLNKLDAFREGTTEVKVRPSFLQDCCDQILSSLQYNFAFFDIKYDCCFVVMEHILAWMQKFMSKEMFFDYYVKIHATMSYYRAIKQSIKQKPEVFEDPKRKLSEGVHVVGFTFGRYIAKELTELTSKYFNSIIEIYRNAFIDYMNHYFTYGPSRGKFTVAMIKGFLSESVAKEVRMAIYVLESCQCDAQSTEGAEIIDLIMRSENKETEFFAYAEILA